MTGSMFDRFTDHAKQSMNGARDVVLHLGHAQLASQHIFRSLVDSGVAAQVLREPPCKLRCSLSSVATLFELSSTLRRSN